MSTTDLAAFYDTVVRPRLEALETGRRATRRAIAGGLLCVLPFVVLFCAAEPVADRVDIPGGAATLAVGSVIGIVVGLVGGLVLFGLSGLAAMVGYRARYKRDVVAPLIAHLCPGSRYVADHQLPRALVKSSGLFGSAAKATGDDVIQGRIGPASFECCDLAFEDRPGRDDDGKVRGILFVHLRSGRRAAGRLVLASRGQGQPEAAIGHDTGAAVPLPAPLDRHFAATSHQSSIASMVLTPALTSAVDAVRSALPGRLLLSFVDEDVFVALFRPRRAFEPPIAKRARLADVEQMAAVLRDVERIVSLLAGAGVGLEPVRSTTEAGEFAGLASDLSQGALLERIVSEGEPSGPKLPSPSVPPGSRITYSPDGIDGLRFGYALPRSFAVLTVFTLVAIASLAAGVALLGGALTIEQVDQALAWVWPEHALSPGLYDAVPLILIAVGAVLWLVAGWNWWTYPRALAIGPALVVVEQGVLRRRRCFTRAEVTGITGAGDRLYVVRNATTLLGGFVVASPPLAPADLVWARETARRYLRR